jgi:benzaldehyde dehydrogenase (NAD)
MDTPLNSRLDGGLPASDWRADASTRDVLEAASGSSLGSIGVATAANTQAACASAKAAQTAWFAAPYEERAAVLRKAADNLEARTEEIANWIVRETGSIGPKAGFEIMLTVKALREAAAMPSQPQGHVLPTAPGKISLCRRLPLGVVAVISPFNFPLYLAMRAVAPALAVGNSVVLKPDPRTSYSGGVIIGELFEQAGLPADVLHVLPGGAEVGAQLCVDPAVAMIQFTGSTSTGRIIGEIAGKHLKKLSLELGGNNSLIILDDADLDLAASAAAWAAYLHQGQICMTSGRILVHEKVYDQIAERLTAKAKNLPAGDPASGQVALGPVIDKTQLDHAHGIVQATIASGAKLHHGGAFDGLYYQATVLTGVTPGMRAFDEEIFGPIASLTKFSNDDEAIALANRGDYGLSAGIISGSVGRAMALGNQLNVGLLHINDQTVGDEVVNPFGGRGQSGNGTSIGGPANWDEFSQWQWVTIRDTPPPYPF